MHHRIRRALSLLFLLLFLVAAPALIVSTAGYRYNLLKGRVERTGVLFVSSKPSKAHIILNGGDTEKETPNRVRRLLPGNYDIALEKEGFHSWEKSIEITSRQTAFLNNILLFRNELPESIFDTPVSQMNISPNNLYAAVQTHTPSHTELRVINLKSGEIFLPYRTENATGASIDITWSPDSSQFFITRKNNHRSTFFLWKNVEPEEMTSLSKFSTTFFENVFWSQEGRFLHAVANNTLYALDMHSISATEIGPAAFAMRIIDSTVFGVFNDASGTTLVRRGLQDDTFEVIGEIPDGNYTHLSGHSKMIALHDKSRSKLLIIDPSSQTNGLTYHELRAQDADWSDDGILLYRNGFELHIFNPSTAIDKLVTRLGEDLGVARWYPENGLVIYSNGKDVLLTQVSDETEMNITTLAHFTELQDIVIDNKGNRAWFVGEISGQHGLWTLRLR